MGWREYPRLLLLFLPALTVELAASYGIDAYARAAGLTLEGVMTTGEQMRLLGVALPLYVLVFTARLATWTFVAARVLDATLGGRRLAQWRRMLAPSLVAGFVLAITYGAGVLLLLVGFFVFFHWFLYVPAQIASGARTLGAAFDASRRFAREHRTQGFTALVLLVGSVPAGLYFAAGVAPAPVGLLLPALVGWVFGPVVALLAASFVSVAAAAPSAPATPAERLVRSTTTCPKCRTLIPYTPTGGAVDVTCPSCGHAGRVL